VNDLYIYTLEKNKPIVIDIPSNPSKVVVTDGFHITRPLELTYNFAHVYCYKISCAIEDDQLLTGLVLVIFFYALGLATQMLFLYLLSCLPLLYLLFLYYVNRKEFIQITQA
jgi:hypothetical protein